MMFTVEDLQSSQAADINQIFGHLTGYGIVEGGVPSDGARPWAVDILDGMTYINGEEAEIEATSLVLDRLEPEELHPDNRTEGGDVPAELVSQDDPRKAIVFVTQDGNIQVAFGAPKEPKPRGTTRFDTYEPSPPDLGGQDVVPLAEVWIGGNAQQVATDDIRDRRLNAQIDVYGATAQTLSAETIIDGSGRELNSLADLEEAITDERVSRVLAEDENHGSDAHHEYWSGNHDDLTNLSENDHHGRYGDTESRDAVRGDLDLSELSVGDDVTPGYHLAAESGEATWVSPPMAEAPLLQSGTVAHSGGSPTTHVIEHITPSQGAYLEIGVNVSVASSPSWNGDYAFSVSTVRQWSDNNGGINAEIELTWDTDPGTGNDLDIRYQVYEMTPEIVSTVFEHSDTLNAIGGGDISPGTLNPWEEFRIPQYPTPSDAPNASLSDIVIAENQDGSGLFVHDGTEWHGPYQSGLSGLSGLTIAGDKDWGGFSIRNLGLGTNATDALQMENIDNHASVSGAHHERTTGEEIDHVSVTNQSSTDHHEPYEDDDAVEAAGLYLKSMPITATEIPNSDSSTTHAAISEGETLHITRVTAYDENGNMPSGLSVVIEDLASDERMYEQTDRHATGDLATIDGPAQLELYLQNYTGATMAAGAMVSGYLEVE